MFKFNSKNLQLTALMTAIEFVGVAVLSLLNYFHAFEQSPEVYFPSNSYLAALQPILFIGLPMLMLISFVLSLYTIVREDERINRNQAITLAMIQLIFAYLVSFTILSGGF